MPIPGTLRAALLCTIACVAVSSSATAVAEQATPPPKNVAILIFDRVAMIDYAGPYEVFAHAGYNVYAVAATKHSIHAAEGLEVVPKYSFADAPQADIVVIPGGGYEAPADSAAVAWIKRQSVHAEHTMSVCNGSFTLANTGLIDGLKSTTTSGNIERMRRTYPQITVVDNQRVVDNGKYLSTGGLSAGIDGALHMVAVVDGEDAAQTVALMIEYTWQPNDVNVRGAMADRLIPDIDLGDVAKMVDMRLQGDKDRWQTSAWVTTKLSGPDLFSAVQGAFEKAYTENGRWQPGSFHATSVGPLKSNLRLSDREGHDWSGTLTVEAIPSDPHEFIVRIATVRIGRPAPTASAHSPPLALRATGPAAAIAWGRLALGAHA